MAQSAVGILINEVAQTRVQLRGVVRAVQERRTPEQNVLKARLDSMNEEEF